MRRRTFCYAAALAAVATLGCSPLGPQKDLTEFYVLNSGAEEEMQQGVRPAGEFSFGVGPVQLATYLDRPQLVTRVGENQVLFSDVGRWAGPLRHSFSRVVTENLAVILESSKVFEFPWFESRRPDVAVEVHVARFEWNVAGYAELLVGWAITNSRGENREWGLHRFTQPADSAATTAAKVAALSATLWQFSELVAVEMQKVLDAGPPEEVLAEGR
jgi:uncharacterized lipoprotein YmbA